MSDAAQLMDDLTEHMRKFRLSRGLSPLPNPVSGYMTAGERREAAAEKRGHDGVDGRNFNRSTDRREPHSLLEPRGL